MSLMKQWNNTILFTLYTNQNLIFISDLTPREFTSSLSRYQLLGSMGNACSTTEMMTIHESELSVPKCQAFGHILLKTECRAVAQARGILQRPARRSCIGGTASGSTRLSLRGAWGHALPSWRDPAGRQCHHWHTPTSIIIPHIFVAADLKRL